MKSKELRDQRAKVQAELDALLSNEVLSDEQRAKSKELDAEYDRLSEEIKAAEKAEKEDAELRARASKRREELSQSTGRRTENTASTPADSLAGRIEVLPPEQFKSLGEQLQAIANVGITGREDNRLQWQNLAPSGASAGVPSDGGYLIQKDFTSSLENRMYEIGLVLQRVREVPIGANSDGLKLNLVDETSRATGSRWGGVQVYWGAEADAATAKKPKFRQQEWELKDLIGLAYMTNRLMQDASALEAVFGQAFSEEMSFVLEDAVINGTGAGTPLGILNSGAMVTVSKETGQPAGTILYENVKKMWSRMWARSRRNAVWLYNQDAEPEIFGMSFPVGTGGVPVFLPPGGVSELPFATLYGRPMLPVEYCATVGTSGDIVLADFSQYLMIRKGAMQADSSIHVRFINNENTFRYIYRTDGQPLWNSPLTPYKGSNTLSPFVKLESRS